MHSVDRHIETERHLLRRHREREVRETPPQPGEHDLQFETSKLTTRAQVRTVPERHVRVVRAVNVQRIRILKNVRIAIGRRKGAYERRHRGSIGFAKNQVLFCHAHSAKGVDGEKPQKFVNGTGDATFEIGVFCFAVDHRLTKGGP